MIGIDKLREMNAEHGRISWSYTTIPQACKHEPAIPVFYHPSGGLPSSDEMDLACHALEALEALLDGAEVTRDIANHNLNYHPSGHGFDSCIGCGALRLRQEEAAKALWERGAR